MDIFNFGSGLAYPSDKLNKIKICFLFVSPCSSGKNFKSKSSLKFLAHPA